MSTVPQLHTINSFVEKHPQMFSKAALYRLIHLGKDQHYSKGTIPGNGIESALTRMGRKIFINESKFFEWLENQNKKGQNYGK